MGSLLHLDNLVRAHYGKLVAYLAASFRDLSLAEEAVQEAFLRAHNIWPQQGVPDAPAAWLLTTARRIILDQKRHDHITHSYAKAYADTHDDMADMSHISEFIFPDARLKLMYVCAHPALDAALHAPLMLQSVLGLTADQIAQAFVVSPATMSQRLVRAKRKIKDAQIPFLIPDADDLPARTDTVLSAIYAAYGTAWNDVSTGHDHTPDGLTDEAIYLARLICGLMPDNPEAKGLLSLILYTHARRATRFGTNGCFTPLYEQDTQLWDTSMLEEAEQYLQHAAKTGVIGRFQIEAAIQSAHTEARCRNLNLRPQIIGLYETLLSIAPSLGSYVGYAAALIQNEHAARALQVLLALDAMQTQNYQPYWATLAAAHAQCGQTEAAHKAYTQAIGLSSHQGVRTYLIHKKALIAE